LQCIFDAFLLSISPNTLTIVLDSSFEGRKIEGNLDEEKGKGET
jgi:hypothetical protein